MSIQHTIIGWYYFKKSRSKRESSKTITSVWSFDEEGTTKVGSIDTNIDIQWSSLIKCLHIFWHGPLNLFNQLINLASILINKEEQI